ncbi:MAG: hypothetical protein OEO23_15250, partial [Gemmatimonadota bacterium]|nr:hypothetical protein [Gemmatimonadota bacterium]
VYGGLQDNGSWFGPSTVWENKGILNAHWTRVGGGDGFSVMPDRADPDRYGYSQSQGGNLQHFDKRTGARRSIRPVHPEGLPLRFNWNAGLTWDPLDPSVIYIGSQFLHRSADQGRTWSVISPDLTTDDPEKQRADESGGLTVDASGAETHTTILSIAPSHLEEGLIWVGTDDGNVQLTRDGGQRWVNVRDRIPGLPKGIWIPDVQPSKHVAGRAYVVAEDHRRGDWTPRVYVTQDYGGTWRALATDGIGGFVHAIEEDPVSPDLLFLGTEFGLRVSLDGGESWESFRAGVPSVPIRDLVVHPRDGDLVLGTHGRGVLVVDDIRPLRALAADPSIREREIHAFEAAPALDVEVAEAIGYRSTGHAMQQGTTRPVGALVNFWTRDPGSVAIQVLDSAASIVYSASVATRPGVNRHHWDLRPAGDADEDAHPRQITVAPGRYTVRAALGGAASESTVDVVSDPRHPLSGADRRGLREALLEANRRVRAALDAQDRLEDLRERVGMVLETLDEDQTDLREQGDALMVRVTELLERHFTGPDCQGECAGDPTVGAVRSPLGRIVGDRGAPSANTRIMIDQAVAAARTISRDVSDLVNGPVADFRDALIAAGYTPMGLR